MACRSEPSSAEDSNNAYNTKGDNDNERQQEVKLSVQDSKGDKTIKLSVQDTSDNDGE